MSQLHFRNHYTSRIYVAIAFPDQGCAAYGTPWGTKGWWPIDPGGEAYVLNNAPMACYYAEALDGAIWSGSQGPVYLKRQAFQSCWGIGDNSPETEVVGMRVVVIGEGNLYMNLVGA
jgi:hypothetical protein